MIGPFGLIAHMAGALVVGGAIGGYAATLFAGTALSIRARDRGMSVELDRILEPEAEYKKRCNEAHLQAMSMQEQMRRGEI